MNDLLLISLLYKFWLSKLLQFGIKNLKYKRNHGKQFLTMVLIKQASKQITSQIFICYLKLKQPVLPNRNEKFD